MLEREAAEESALKADARVQPSLAKAVFQVPLPSAPTGAVQPGPGRVETQEEKDLRELQASMSISSTGRWSETQEERELRELQASMMS